MLFKDYLAAINELAKNNPETLEMNVIYVSDDGGNSYQEVGYEASVDTFYREGPRNFDRVHVDDIGEYDSGDIIKGVIIN